MPQKELVLTENEALNLPFLDCVALDESAFNGISPPYEDLKIFREHVQFAKHTLHPRVLDAGCGPAYYVEELARYFRYEGIDISEKMLEVARAKNPELSFKRRSFRETGFPDKHFHGIWACCALNTTPKDQVPLVLDEWRRILKPEGLVMFVMPNHGYSGEEVTPTTYGVPLFYASWSPREFLRTVICSGFQIVSSNDRDANNAFSILARK